MSRNRLFGTTLGRCHYRRPNQRPRSWSRLAVEALENRRLLTWFGFEDVIGGFVYTIEGSEFDDDGVIFTNTTTLDTEFIIEWEDGSGMCQTLQGSFSAGDVANEAATRGFPVGDFMGVNVKLLGGDDRFAGDGSNTVGELSCSSIPVFTPGGLMLLDTLIIAGNGGKDTINGSPGPDDVSGGDDNDTISTGDGQDTIDGGAGDDTIWGGDDDDMLAGGDGNDEIKGFGGDDELDGGNGNDTLLGGDGNDNLQGGGDNDDLNGEGDVDAYSAGPGDDTLRTAYLPGATPGSGQLEDLIQLVGSLFGGIGKDNFLISGADDPLDRSDVKSELDAAMGLGLSDFGANDELSFSGDISIYGLVWDDANSDGFWQRGEAALSGVTVRLYAYSPGSRQLIREDTTDEMGGYFFNDASGLLGDFFVVEVVPPNGWTFTRYVDEAPTFSSAPVANNILPIERRSTAILPDVISMKPSRAATIDAGLVPIWGKPAGSIDAFTEDNFEIIVVPADAPFASLDEAQDTIRGAEGEDALDGGDHSVINFDEEAKPIWQFWFSSPNEFPEEASAVQTTVTVSGKNSVYFAGQSSDFLAGLADGDPELKGFSVSDFSGDLGDPDVIPQGIDITGFGDRLDISASGLWGNTPTPDSGPEGKEGTSELTRDQYDFLGISRIGADLNTEDVPVAVEIRGGGCLVETEGHGARSGLHIWRLTHESKAGRPWSPTQLAPSGA